MQALALEQLQRCPPSSEEPIGRDESPSPKKKAGASKWKSLSVRNVLKEGREYRKSRESSRNIEAHSTRESGGEQSIQNEQEPKDHASEAEPSPGEMYSHNICEGDDGKSTQQGQHIIRDQGGHSWLSESKQHIKKGEASDEEESWYEPKLVDSCMMVALNQAMLSEDSDGADLDYGTQSRMQRTNSDNPGDAVTEGVASSMLRTDTSDSDDHEYHSDFADDEHVHIEISNG